MKKFFGIIYKATFENGKCYIGQTTKTLKTRRSAHITNNHRKNVCFRRAIDKYGKDSISWEIIDTASSIEELNEKEQYWIEYYNSYINSENSNGYNMTLGGSSTLGWIPSQKTKENISKSLKGKFAGNKSPQYGKTGELSTWWGRKHTEEEKRKIAEGNKKPKSEDTKRKISASLKGKPPWNKGIPRTSEEKRKISEAKIGKKLSAKALEKQKLCHKGEKHGKATLTDEEVASIIFELLDGIKVNALAERYGVTYNTISLIKYNRTWKHIFPEIREEIRKIKVKNSGNK